MPRTSPRRPVTAVGLIALACVAAASCGGARQRATATIRHAGAATHGATGRPRIATAAVTYRPLFRLNAPLRDPASAALPGGRFALIGGLDSSDVSTPEITLGTQRGVLRTGALPLAQHDAQAATFDGQVFVFGGGADTELNHVIAYDPDGGGVRDVGSLPHAQSDVAVAASPQEAFIIGGYTGSTWLDTILARRPGGPARLVGRLPVGLRYAAAVAADGRVLILGGTTPAGASRNIYSFDPVRRTVTRLGRLPEPVTHATAALLGGLVYLIGGRGDDLSSQTSRVLAVDPHTGAVRSAGRLPRPLSDAAGVSLGHAILLAGGLTPDGTQSRVGELVPRRP